MQLSGSARRLAEELEDHGVSLDEDESVREMLLDELDYARRIPMFEGRRPMYGSFSMPPGTDIRNAVGVADLIALDGMPREMARTFADGRSAFVVNHHDRPSDLACFDRSVQYEADLVALQQMTGARIVQRSAVFGQVRLFTEQRVVSWDGQGWIDRPTAAALLQRLLDCSPEIDPDVARGLLDLSVHWLSPSRVGATIVVHESNFEWASMDVSTKFRAPQLSLKNRQHYPALFARCSSTTWRRSSPPTAASSTSAWACGPARRRSATPTASTAACVTVRRNGSAGITRRRRSRSLARTGL